MKKIRLGEATTVTFPSEPFSDSGPLQDQYGVNNENGYFQACFLKSNFDVGIQSESIYKIKKFYSEYIMGMADGLNGKIASIKYAKMKGYIYVDATYNYADKASQIPITMKSRSVTYMGRIYSVNYINQTSVFDDYSEVCDEFLNSLEIFAKANGEPLDPGGPFYDSEAKTTGEMIWRIFIAFFVVTCVTIVSIYFGTRKSRRERANQVKNL